MNRESIRMIRQWFNSVQSPGNGAGIELLVVTGCKLKLRVAIERFHQGELLNNSSLNTLK
jgi:hypothetical protein